ncbi:DUF6000 family protein [Streptomyces abikoensis]
MPDDSVETLAAVRRFVMPGRRYAKMQGWSLKNADSEVRWKFGAALREDASRATHSDFVSLLKADWRARMTAAWLIAAAGRTEFRSLLRHLLMADESRECVNAYCLALSVFGSREDANILVEYLDRTPVVDGKRVGQDWALAALLCVDPAAQSDAVVRFVHPGEEVILVGYLRTYIKEHSAQPIPPAEAGNPLAEFDEWRSVPLPADWHILESEAERKEFDRRLVSRMAEGDPMHYLAPLSVASCLRCGALLYGTAPGPVRWLVAAPAGGDAARYEEFAGREQMAEGLRRHSSSVH